MNSLVGKDFFESILNQFLVLDKFLIPWKLSNFKSFCYFHKIHFENFQFKVESMLLDVVDPISIDTSNIVECEYKEDTIRGYGCFVYYRPNFETRIFNRLYLPNITHLTLFFTFHHLEDSHISCLTSLIYLDLGMYNYFTNEAVISLKNLKNLFLRNNSRITAEIFPHLPKLVMLQLKSDSSIRITDIPDTVATVITNVYDTACPCCDNYDSECSTKQIR